MSQWQPIETAPKDGTKILGFDPQGVRGPVCAVIYWYSHQSQSFEEAGDGLFRKVLHEPVEWWEGASYSPFRATHWMPLPKPPEAKP